MSGGEVPCSGEEGAGPSHGKTGKPFQDLLTYSSIGKRQCKLFLLCFPHFIGLPNPQTLEMIGVRDAGTSKAACPYGGNTQTSFTWSGPRA